MRLALRLHYTSCIPLPGAAGGPGAQCMSGDIAEGVPPMEYPTNPLTGWMTKGKNRRWWLLWENGTFHCFKDPTDTKKKKSKPVETIKLEDMFVDEPGSPSAPGNTFNLLPIGLGKEAHAFAVDTDRPVQDAQAWVTALTRVIQSSNPEAKWAKGLQKVKLQAWVDKDAVEDHVDFMFKISGSGGEWGFKQRFSGLERWHLDSVKPAYGKAAPTFPAKHALKLSKAKDKFVENRRQDLCRYFIQLLAQPGFLQSDELNVLLNKQANALLADRKRRASVAAVDIEEAIADAEEFDESTLQASEEWLALHTAMPTVRR